MSPLVVSRLLSKQVVLLMGRFENHPNLRLHVNNVAMADADSSPLEHLTMRAITNPLAQTQHTIALSAFAMGLGALVSKRP